MWKSVFQLTLLHTAISSNPEPGVEFNHGEWVVFNIVTQHQLKTKLNIDESDESALHESAANGDE